jgi:hypothetical protein
MTTQLAVEYRSYEYYQKISLGWRVASGPFTAPDGVQWVLMEYVE